MTGYSENPIAKLSILLVASLGASSLAWGAESGIADRSIKPLSYETLKELSLNRNSITKHEAELEALINGVVVSNQASRDGIRPHKQTHEILGDSIGLTSWNIEKSLNVEKDIIPVLKDVKEFERRMDPEIFQNVDKRDRALMQRLRLLNSDILVLQEMDVGVARSGYIDAPKRLAQTLGMNYTYAPNQVELNPAYFTDGDPLKVDPKKYKGLFGTAVLSRYPIKNVRVKQLDYQPYDWYDGEVADIYPLEGLRRLGAKVALDEKIEKERKRGGRTLHIVDLHVPGLPNDTLTVVNVHLEIKARPEDRAKQMEEILAEIKDIKNPVIMAGDFNSSSTDISPTNLARVAARTVTDPQKLFALGLTAATEASTPINLGLKVANNLKNLYNPLGVHIPVLAPNPQYEQFNGIKNFVFDDGYCFDFRGDKDRSLPHLFWGRQAANSNQKGKILGFKPSFRTDRVWGVFGKQRLDWIFVKNNEVTQCGDTKEASEQSYKLAPHFGENLDLFNRGVVNPFSDHDPIYTALPLQEPTQLNDQIAQKKRRGLFEKEPATEIAERTHKTPTLRAYPISESEYQSSEASAEPYAEVSPAKKKGFLGKVIQGLKESSARAQTKPRKTRPFMYRK